MMAIQKENFLSTVFFIVFAVLGFKFVISKVEHLFIT